MIRLWSGWFTATSTPPGPGRAPLPQLIVLDCKGGPDPAVKLTGPPGCCTALAPAGLRSGLMKPGCPSGSSRPGTWPSFSTR